MAEEDLGEETEILRVEAVPAAERTTNIAVDGGDQIVTIAEVSVAVTVAVKVVAAPLVVASVATTAKNLPPDGAGL